MYLCPFPQLYEALLLYNYCMDNVFTELVIIQHALHFNCSIYFFAVRWTTNESFFFFFSASFCPSRQRSQKKFNFLNWQSWSFSLFRNWKKKTLLTFCSLKSHGCEFLNLWELKNIPSYIFHASPDLHSLLKVTLIIIVNCFLVTHCNVNTVYAV